MRFSLTSIRFVLTGGVTLCIVLVGGLVGGISIWGGMSSAMSLTRMAQVKQTMMLSEELTSFTNSLRQEAATISEVIGQSAFGLNNKEIITILSAYSEHKSSLTSITIVRKNRTNVWVGRWKGEVVHEVNTELAEEAYVYAIEGRPGDGGEGFEDIYIEPSEGRPVITYTKHFADQSNQPAGTLYLDLGLKTLSKSLSDIPGPDQEKIFIFDANGSAIAHPSLIKMEAYKTFRKVPHIGNLGDPVAKAIYQKISTGNFDMTDIKVGKEAWLVSIARNQDVGDSDWFAVSVIPRQVVLGPVLDRAKLVTFISLVIVVAAIIISQLVGRSIARPLGKLASAAAAVQELDLKLAVSELSYFDELRKTEKAFRAMLRSLDVFAKYVPSSLVRRLMQLQANGYSVIAEERKVTILFTDVVGYTSISDGMPPAELAALLNEYFEILVDKVIEHGGTVDKFIGDALMVFWNAPDHQPDHADRAIQAGLAIQEAVRGFNALRSAKGLMPLETRIGMHTGLVLAGEIGSTERMNYTIVGDAVNTAARLESLGKSVGQMLCISSSTKDEAHGIYQWQEVDRIILRGRSDQTLVYTIKDA